MSASTRPSDGSLLALLEQVRRVSSQAKFLLIIRSLALALTICLIAGLLLGLLDWQMRWNSIAVRWLQSSLLCLTGIWSIAAILVPAFRSRLTPADAAKKIEQHFPDLGDKLSSSIAFASGKTESMVLEQATIHQTQSLCEGIAFSSILNRRPVIHTLGSLLCVGMILAWMFVIQPEHAALAAARLAKPWTALAWPQKYYLTMEELPDAVMAGTDVQLWVREESNRLPSDTQLIVADSSGIQRLKPSDEGSLLLENVEESFEVRAIGGDDRSMPWQRIEVHRGVSVAQHQWTLRPPAYLGEEQRKVEGQIIELYAGTEATLRGELTGLVTGVQLSTDQSDTAYEGKVIDRQSFLFEDLEFSEPAVLQLQVANEHGLMQNDVESWTIRVRRDDPPQVAWTMATLEKGLRPQASLQLSWSSVDDLGIASTGLTVTINGSSEAVPQKSLQTTKNQSVEQRVDLQLSRFKLKAGDSLELYAWAKDQNKQEGRTNLLKFSIVDDQTFAQEFQEEQQRLKKKLDQLIDQQRDSTRKTIEAEQSIAAQQTDSLRSLENALESQVSSQTLLDGEGGLLGETENALAGTSANGWESSEVERLKQIQDKLRQLSDGELDAAVANLSESLNALSEGRSPQLSKSRAHQENALRVLESLSAGMASQDALRRVSQQLEVLADDQQQLRTATQSAPDSDSLDEVLSDQQRSLARRASSIQNQLQQLSSNLDPSDTESKLRVDRAQEQLAKQPLVSRMRGAATDLEEGRSQAAATKQQSVVQQLRALQETVLGQDVTPQQAIADALEEAQDELQNLADRQSDISKQLGKDSVATEEVGSQWQSLNEQTKELRDRIEALGAPMAADAIKRASEHQQKGLSNLASDTSEALTDSAQANEELLSGIDEIEAARDALREQQEAEAVWKMVEATEAILNQQKQINQELAQWQTTPLQPGLQTLGAKQGEIANELEELKEDADAMIAVGIAMEAAIADMRLVEANLDRNNISQATLEDATAAQTRLELILETLMQVARQRNNAAPNNDSEGEDQQDNEQENLSLASLELLVKLQAWLSERTSQIASLKSNEKENVMVIQQRVQSLAKEQRQILIEFQRIQQIATP